MDKDEETRPGVLALWQDCAPGAAATLESWYQGEHLKERVSLPGFRRARRSHCGDRHLPADL